MVRGGIVGDFQLGEAVAVVDMCSVGVDKIDRDAVGVGKGIAVGRFVF